ncbi:MAG TPA: sulfotransferase domain-containing protein, partial [Micromonosporaceae bacterium]
RLARSGLVELCENDVEFDAAIRATLASPARVRIDPAAGQVAVSHSALKVGEIADQLAADRVRVPRQRREAKVPQPAGTGTGRHRASAPRGPAVPVSPTPAPIAAPRQPRSTTEPAPVRVLFIGGWGRSGSTLAERLIAEMPDVVGAGEVTHLWQRALIDNERCSCGKTLRDCPFWEKVGAEAFGGWERIDPYDVLALKRRVDRTRNVGRLALPARLNRRRDLARYTDLHRRLYAAIATVAGATVVIDSSKHISLASTLRHEPGIDLRVLHVVRDGRGVAYSWSKEVVRPEAASGTDALMPQYSILKSGLLWSTHNALFGVVKAAGARVMRLRYEDLMADPIGTLATIRSFADLPAGVVDYIAPDADGAMVAQLSAPHSIAGNPMRFTSGGVKLRTDSAWRAAMPAPKRRLVTVLTWPGRVRYGYLDRARPSRRSTE